jgi:ferrochelatase
MPYQAEPALPHGTAPRILLLVNLGTPDAPTAPALRRYLAEFLSDPRVVEIPRLLWLPLLHGVILNTRPAKSAAKYASIWTDNGSPLAHWTSVQGRMLQGYLGERGLMPSQVLVRTAMRYGNPSVASVLDELKAENATRVLVLPLYPQYAAATTASVNDAVMAWQMRQRRQPELRFVNHYHDDPGYIAALAQRVRSHWGREGRGDRLVLSFHGVPERSLTLGDPYHCECHKTARLLAERLGLQAGQWRVSFQSRFGRAKWLGPSTESVLQELGAQRLQRLDVLCPGFAADCLETLEEIAIEGAETFHQAGGGTLRYIPCLNDSAEGMQSLAAIAERHLSGWPTQVAAPTADELTAQAARARALGAPA